MTGSVWNRQLCIIMSTDVDFQLSLARVFTFAFTRAWIYLPPSQHVPRYPGRHLHPLLKGVPPFLHWSLLHARTWSKLYGQDPPHAWTTVFLLVLFWVPLVPQGWLQALHELQELTWHGRALQGGGERRRRRRRHESVSLARTSRTQTIAKNSVIRIFSLRI